MSKQNKKKNDFANQTRSILSTQKVNSPPLLDEPIEIKYQDWPESVKPMVSINCATYKHEPFIEQAIESFLMQKTRFKVEILIHDDASPDRTAEIVKEYESRYPQPIKGIYQTENQHSLGVEPGLMNIDRSQGKYITICDGDDYWIDPLKLQKQADFLEKNPGFSICTGGYKSLYPGNRTRIVNFAQERGKENGFEFSLEEMKDTWLTQTLTSMFRRDAIAEVDLYKYEHSRDIHLFYHIVKNHRGFYFPDVFGVYRIHEGGIHSMKHEKTQRNITYLCYRELYLHNKDEFTRRKCFKRTVGLLKFNLYNSYKENKFLTNLRLYAEAIFLVGALAEVKTLFSVFLKDKWIHQVKSMFKKSELTN